ncbi:MAG TPA: EF-hand domain-containing protein [Vicinamibacterales bacterium]|jgi:hypothetical protein|nr:EF-hand domain-containing protein [Vicinamibacterales bacterium]
MINPLDSTSTTTGVSPLIEQIAQRVDANGDGSISTSEFSSFLTNLLQSISQAAHGTASTSTASSSSSSTGSSTDALPPCPPGWDSEKWVDPTHTTPKYVVGRILAKYPPTPAGLQAALPEIQSAMPGTTLDGDDTLNIPNVGYIDVGVAFGAGGGVGWDWQVTG